jgi:hypothetical protein
MEKTEQLRIRCSKGTSTKFHVFVAQFGFKDQEDALIGLLDLAEKNLSKAKVLWG